MSWKIYKQGTPDNAKDTLKALQTDLRPVLQGIDWLKAELPAIKDHI